MRRVFTGGHIAKMNNNKRVHSGKTVSSTRLFLELVKLKSAALSGSDGDTLTLKAYVDDTLILTATDSAPLVNNFKTGFFFTGVSDGYITSYQITQP